MVRSEYPVIDTVATGNNIRQLREKSGLTVKDLQSYFGFEMPQAIYKWQRGESLPSVDNLYALGRLLDVPMEQIIVQTQPLHTCKERQERTCRSDRFFSICTFPSVCKKPSKSRRSAVIIRQCTGAQRCAPYPGLLAQLVERMGHNHDAAGSSPSQTTTKALSFRSRKAGRQGIFVTYMLCLPCLIKDVKIS